MDEPMEDDYGSESMHSPDIKPECLPQQISKGDGFPIQNINEYDIITSQEGHVKEIRHK